MDGVGMLKDFESEGLLAHCTVLCLSGLNSADASRKALARSR